MSLSVLFVRTMCIGLSCSAETVDGDLDSFNQKLGGETLALSFKSTRALNSHILQRSRDI